MAIYRLDQLESSAIKSKENDKYGASIFLDVPQLKLQSIYAKLAAETQIPRLLDFFWFDRAVMYRLLCDMKVNNTQYAGVKFEYNEASEIIIKNELVSLTLNGDGEALVIRHSNGDGEISKGDVINGLIPILITLAILINYDIEFYKAMPTETVELPDDLDFSEEPSEPVDDFANSDWIESEMPESTLPYRAGKGARKQKSEVFKLITPHLQNPAHIQMMDVTNLDLWNKLLEYQSHYIEIDDIGFAMTSDSNRKIIGHIRITTPKWYVELRVRNNKRTTVLTTFSSIDPENESDQSTIARVLDAIAALMEMTHA